MANLHRPSAPEKVNEEVPWWDYFSLRPLRNGMVEAFDKENGSRKVWATFDDAKRSVIEQSKPRIVRDLMDS